MFFPLFLSILMGVKEPLTGKAEAISIKKNSSLNSADGFSGATGFLGLEFTHSVKGSLVRSQQHLHLAFEFQIEYLSFG